MSGMESGAPSPNFQGAPIDHLSDCSDDLSDCPDDLSECSLAKQDTHLQARPNAEARTNAEAESIEKYASPEEALLPTPPETQATGYVTPPTQPSTPSATVVRDLGASPSLASPITFPSPTQPSTPTVTVVRDSRASTPNTFPPPPSAGSKSGQNGSTPSQRGRGRGRTTRDIHRARHSTPPTPRRSTRIRRPPVTMTEKEASPEPRPSRIVILKISGVYLSQFESRDSGVPRNLALTLDVTKKRKRAPANVTPSPQKYARKEQEQGVVEPESQTDLVSRPSDDQGNFPSQPSGTSRGIDQPLIPSPLSHDFDSSSAQDQLNPPAAPDSSTPTSASDDTLWATASRLKAANPYGGQKPEPSAQPQVWAETRYDLCETVPYFRSFKSGYYGNNGFACAFLFANSASKRDFIDGSVVISRAGGGLTPDKTTGELSLGDDQTEKHQTQALRNNIRRHNPVVLMTSDNNPCMPSQPPHKYSVLGYFKPTHIWWEKVRERNSDKRFLRYRFERIDPKGETSWWQPKDTEEIAKPGSLQPPIVQSCSSCHKPSHQVYLQGWMCLIPDCEAFWKLPTPTGELHDPEESELMYDPRFLKQKTTWPNEHHPFSLLPKEVELSSRSRPEDFCSKPSWKGIVCRCGRCITRIWWRGWICPTPGCNFEKIPVPSVIPAAAIRDPYFPLTDGYMPSRDHAAGNIGVSEPIWAHNYRTEYYTIPGIEGGIFHMIANQTVVEEPGGPDDMFEELQRVDIGLRRRPIGSEKMKDPLMTRHINTNFGMPYKFVAAGIGTRSFEEAEARCITDTRSRLNWAMRTVDALQKGKPVEDVADEWKSKEFNEVLALGYFEDQAIGFHDDGEPGVGPSIATLSLGAPGSMHLRMKRNHYYGVSKAGVYDHKFPPVPGCDKYKERLDAHSTILNNAPRGTGLNPYLRAVATDLGLKKAKDQKQVPNAITLALGHGDSVIMHGADIQTYYEHSVSHTGTLRFALTCRTIDPNSLAEADRPSYKVGPDMGVYDGSKLPVPKDVMGLPIENGTKFSVPKDTMGLPVETETNLSVDMALPFEQPETGEPEAGDDEEGNEGDDDGHKDDEDNE